MPTTLLCWLNTPITFEKEDIAREKPGSNDFQCGTATTPTICPRCDGPATLTLHFCQEYGSGFSQCWYGKYDHFTLTCDADAGGDDDDDDDSGGSVCSMGCEFAHADIVCGCDVEPPRCADCLANAFECVKMELGFDERHDGSILLAAARLFDEDD